MIKKYAFFLPQFHEIEENNKWWGKGFTEWVNVKKANPLFKNHNQPKVPLDGYYNLLDKKTVINQTNLMNKNQIDGLIYYHYYFKGKKLLEKPAENLLKWKDINQKFFFCWANHSWIKSWNGTKDLLIEQVYGNQGDWEEHFQYLLQFFCDERYVKENNKPLLMIFKSDFIEKNEMFKYFEKRCKESGFNGICLIETYSAINGTKSFDSFRKNISSVTSYVFFREPTYGLSVYSNSIKNIPYRFVSKFKRLFGMRTIRKYSGNNIYKSSINTIVKGDNILHGLFFEWDNTPRHGERGYVIKPVNNKYFRKYMSLISDEPYVFINAWNEWAEGMILEGTVDSKYKYLEWINDWSNEGKRK